MNTSFNPSPLSALALTQRQLADWQQFHADLTLREASATELRYAQAQIDYLTAEVEALTPKGDAQ